MIINLYCHLNIIVRRHIFDWTFQINVTSYELRPMDCLWQRFANGFWIESGFSFCVFFFFFFVPLPDSALVWHNRINRSSPKIFRYIFHCHFSFNSAYSFLFVFDNRFDCHFEQGARKKKRTYERNNKKKYRSPKLKNIGKDQRIISMNRLMYLFIYFIYSDEFGWSVALGSFVEFGWSQWRMRFIYVFFFFVWHMPFILTNVVKVVVGIVSFMHCIWYLWKNVQKYFNPIGNAWKCCGRS